MPDDRRWAECNDLALLLEAPAEVDVVAGLAVLGVEATDLVEGPAVESHVAAGDVLCHHVGEEHVAGAAGCGRHAGLLPVLGRRGDIGAADTRVVPGEEGADQIVEPVGIGHAVAVGVGEDLTGGVGRSDIAGDAQAHVRLVDRIHPRVVGDDLPGVVSRAVVDKNHLVVGVVDLLE